LSSAQNQLGANVALVTSGVYYDGPALTLSAGTWILFGVLMINAGGGTADYNAKLWDGTNVAAELDSTAPGTGYDLVLPFAARVVIASGTPTWKVSVARSIISGGNILTTAGHSAAANKASTLVAIQVA
jgi:hypothetical protein